MRSFMAGRPRNLLVGFCMAAVLGLSSMPVLAQDAPAPPPPPEAPTPPPAPPPAPTIPGSPNLSVATVRMENGYRASKLIGAAVFNDQNQQVGSLDDLILNKDERAALAVISVGGFLGVGGKLVAVPYGQLHIDDKGKVILPEASKEELNGRPNFTY